MTGVPVWIFFQIILVFCLCFPERTSGRDLRYDLARPEPRRLDIRDSVFRNPLLFGTRVINSRTVARARVVALAVACSRIVNLELEFEQRPVAGDIRVKHDLNRFRMRAVVAISGVRDVTTAIANAR
jgi:hypothetical protein